MTETLVNLVKEIGKIPELKNVLITCNEVPTSSCIHIEATWAAKNYATYEKNTLVSKYIYNIDQNNVHLLPPSIQDKRIILSATSPVGQKYAHLFQDNDSCFVNILSSGESVTINLKEKELHGKVYKDSELSSFCWSHDSRYLAFVAEKKRPKSVGFLEKITQSDSKGWGEKNAYQDDWGEQMEGQQQSVIVVLDSKTEDVKVLNIPDGLCGGQIVWSHQGCIVGVAFVTDPYRLGLIYCRNRESFIFHLDLEGHMTELTERGVHVQTPRFSPDGSMLVYFRSPVGGPHVRSAQLMLMNWNTTEIISQDRNLKAVTLIDHVDTVLILENGNSFFGLCGKTSLPLRCWSANGQKIVFSTPNNFQETTYVYNLGTKTIEQFTADGSLSALDVKGNYILASYSSFTKPNRIILLEMNKTKPSSPQTLVDISPVLKVAEIPEDWRDHWTFVNSHPHTDQSVSELPVSVLYFGPVKPCSDTKLRPLIVWIHGGPHSLVEDTFIAGASFFVRLGYSVIFPNYRGSLGQGRKSLESLPGHCGSLDVSDVYQSTLQCLQRYKSVIDPSRIALYGGSHGGFLVTHLSAQYPETYKVVSSRNPVIDIASMTVTTDITDWNFVESGHTYEIGKAPTAEIMSKMFSMSPLSLVDRVRAPTLLLLGNEDRRVPMSQGMFYYKMLLARKVPTKTYVYDDCHALSKVDVEADCLIHTALWFNNHL